MINAGIIGGSGYTAGELIRLLLQHPNINIDFVFSTSCSGKPVTSIHRDLIGETNLKFISEINPNVDVLILCTGHGNSTKVLQKHSISANTKIIDLSRDFRFIENNSFEKRIFTYGLPELQKRKITAAENIANPGCFATAIQLALLPLADASTLENDIHIHGITGATGAGSSLRTTTNFNWRNDNVSIYKALNHQHVGEIEQSLRVLSPSFESNLNFIPMRGNFTRGIFISAYTQSNLSLELAKSLFTEFYADAPFVHLSEKPLHLKQVVNTNKCLLHLQKKDGKILVTSIIDNLLKGASGQALQNINLMFGFKETSGLNLKANYF